MSVTARAAAVMVTLVGVWLSPSDMSEASAAALPDAGWEEVTVGVLPVRYFGRGAEALFADQPSLEPALASVGAWHRRLEGAFGALDLISVLDTDAVRAKVERTDAYRQGVAAGASWFQLALAAYRDVKPGRALEHLQRAREQYFNGYVGLVRPNEVATVELYRGLALTEIGRAADAQEAFASMLALDPGRRFRPGYHPAPIEAALTRAATEVGVTIGARLDTPEVAGRLESLGRLLDIDVWVLAWVDGPPDALVLHLTAVDLGLKRVTLNEAIRLDDRDHADEALSRSLSAWHSCTVEAKRGLLRPPKPRPEWFVDIAYVHALWATHERTRDLLQAPGAQISVTYEPTPTFQVFAKTTQLVTVSDGNADLVDVILSSHLTVGAGLSVGSRKVRFYVRFGIELGASLTDIQMTTDVDCKFFGSDSELCGSVFKAEAPSLLAGFETSIGVRAALGDSWYLTGGLGVVSYFADARISDVLNFPVQASLGFGTPF